MPHIVCKPNVAQYTLCGIGVVENCPTVLVHGRGGKLWCRDTVHIIFVSADSGVNSERTCTCQ